MTSFCHFRCCSCSKCWCITTSFYFHYCVTIHVTLSGYERCVSNSRDCLIIPFSVTRVPIIAFAMAAIDYFTFRQRDNSYRECLSSRMRFMGQSWRGRSLYIAVYISIRCAVYYTLSFRRLHYYIGFEHCFSVSFHVHLHGTIYVWCREFVPLNNWIKFCEFLFVVKSKIIVFLSYN